MPTLNHDYSARDRLAWRCISIIIGIILVIAAFVGDNDMLSLGLGVIGSFLAIDGMINLRRLYTPRQKK